MAEVLMPRLSDSMEEGTVLSWLLADGEEVQRGAELVEIETDKATMTYEADAAGTLQRVAGEGDTLPVGAVIAHLLGDGEQAPAGDSAPAPPPEPETPAKPAASTEGDAALSGRHSPQLLSSTSPTAAVGVAASPVARRVAAEHGVDLSSLSGSGPRGRVVKADVEQALAADPGRRSGPYRDQTSPTSEPKAPAEPGTAKGEVTVIEPSRLQQVVARRMAESKALIPEFTLTTEIDMQRCVELRAQLKQLDKRVSYNDMVVKACALALKQHPRANGSYNRDNQFELYSRVNVGIAVAADDALVVPTIFDADSKPLDEIATTTRELAKRVRSGEITPPELSGGTFTVSNLGMFGVTEFTAVINAPQAAILAVGAMNERPVEVGGELVTRPIMAVTLTSDHRILYGADAAQFLAAIKAHLERPVTLML